MGSPDTILIEDIESFIQKVDWTNVDISQKEISSIKDVSHFRTHDLDGCLMSYLVSFDGRLKSQHFEHYEYVSDEGATQKMAIKKRGEYWIDELFDGHVVIQSCLSTDEGIKGPDVVFRLQFLSGVISNVKCLGYSFGYLEQGKSKFKKIIKTAFSLFR